MNNKLQEIFSIMNNNSVENSFDRFQDMINNRTGNLESHKAFQLFKGKRKLKF